MISISSDHITYPSNLRFSRLRGAFVLEAILKRPGPSVGLDQIKLMPHLNQIILALNHTPLKFNIAPEKWWLEDYFPIGKVTFQGLC